jgi:hypothetical protein
LVGTRQPGRSDKGFDNKFLLSNAPFLKKEEEAERGQQKAKKPGHGKAKMIMPQQ